MQKYSKILLFIIFLSNIVYSQGSKLFQPEKLHYTVTYKWGLIHKDAGKATLTLSEKGDRYDVMLAAKTLPWADRIYQVRDTLKASFTSSLIPISYTKITHEKGKYNFDQIKYNKVGNTTYGKVSAQKLRDGVMKVKNRELNATGPVYDMLSVFYYLRKLNYTKLSQNQVYKATVFSGSKKETITIRSLGKTTIKLRNGSEREAYHIQFKFTSDGGKKSSDDIDAYISTDSQHVPLYIVGKIAIGEVRAYLD